MKSWWRAGGVRAGLALSLVSAMCATSVAQAVEAVAPTSTYIVTVDGDFNDVVRGQLRDAGITIDDEFEYAFDGFVVDLAAYQLPFVQSLELLRHCDSGHRHQSIVRHCSNQHQSLSRH